jgi:hypothetical protein
MHQQDADAGSVGAIDVPLGFDDVFVALGQNLGRQIK